MLRQAQHDKVQESSIACNQIHSCKFKYECLKKFDWKAKMKLFYFHSLSIRVGTPQQQPRRRCKNSG